MVHLTSSILVCAQQRCAIMCPCFGPPQPPNKRKTRSSLLSHPLIEAGPSRLASLGPSAIDLESQRTHETHRHSPLYCRLLPIKSVAKVRFKRCPSDPSDSEKQRSAVHAFLLGSQSAGHSKDTIHWLATQLQSLVFFPQKRGSGRVLQDEGHSAATQRSTLGTKDPETCFGHSQHSDVLSDNSPSQVERSMNCLGASWALLEIRWKRFFLSFSHNSRSWFGFFIR